MRLKLAPLFLLISCPAILFAQEAGFENVRLEMLNGSSIRATISAIDANGILTGKNIPTQLSIDQIVEIKTDRTVSASTNSRLKILLAGGGVLNASSPRVVDEKLSFRSQLNFNELKLELIKAIVWVDSPRVQEAMKDRSPDNDLVIVQTEKGTRSVEGLLEKIDETHVHINYNGKSRKISLDIVNAVVAADLGLKTPQGSAAQLSLTDGSKIAGTISGLGNGVIKLELAGRNFIDVESANVAGVLIQSDHLVYLSDLEPIEVQENSPFVSQRGWQRNKSSMGNPLTLNFVSRPKAVSFDKGIGVQSFSQLVFKNENEFTRFRAIVGIDAETSGRGDCQMSLVGDGVRLWSQRVKADSDPSSVSVDITGMENIALVVETGEQFDLGDHANWCMARFTKTE